MEKSLTDLSLNNIRAKLANSENILADLATMQLPNDLLQKLFMNPSPMRKAKFCYSLSYDTMSIKEGYKNIEIDFDFNRQVYTDAGFYYCFKLIRDPELIIEQAEVSGKYESTPDHYIIPINIFRDFIELS